MKSYVSEAVVKMFSSKTRCCTALDDNEVILSVATMSKLRSNSRPNSMQMQKLMPIATNREQAINNCGTGHVEGARLYKHEQMVAKLLRQPLPACSETRIHISRLE